MSLKRFSVLFLSLLLSLFLCVSALAAQGTFIVEDGVTVIEAEAYDNCVGLVNMILPSSLQNIGTRAFQSCTNLRQIDMSETVVSSIASGTFTGCANLEWVGFPLSLTSIASDAFTGCDNITHISYPGKAEDLVPITENVPELAHAMEALLTPNETTIEQTENGYIETIFSTISGEKRINVYQYDEIGVAKLISSESFNANGQLFYASSVNSRGITTEKFYNEFSQLIKRVVTYNAEYKDVYTYTYFTTDTNSHCSHISAYGPGVSINEQEFYENGDIKETTHNNSDGSFDRYFYYPGTKPRGSYQVDVNGNISESYLDENGRHTYDLYTRNDGYSMRSTYNYDENDLLISCFTVDSNGATTAEDIYSYDENNVLVSKITTKANGWYYESRYYPNGRESYSLYRKDDYFSENYYAENGTPVSSKTQYSEGEIEETTYDENGNTISSTQTHADGSSSEVRYNDQWQVIFRSSNDGNGYLTETHYEYDAFGECVVSYGKNTNPDGSWTEFRYENDLLVYERFPENGNLDIIVTFTYEYDENGNQIKAVLYTPDGRISSTTTREFDSNGNRILEIVRYSTGRVYTYKYNENGKKIEEIQMDENENITFHEIREYDSNGNRISQIVTNASGDVQTLKFYENQHIREYIIEYADGSTVISRYDEDGNLIEYIEQ